MLDHDANVIDHAIYDSYGQLVEETSLATPGATADPPPTPMAPTRGTDFSPCSQPRANHLTD
ncbi:MAG: hypothetical protein IT425_05570 [Pirellulales bacterium]|nr:hypothetical protein [Pirellulales bacterium]